MLTRLKVNGFKNLLDVDLRFGPFTCLAGPSGSGKSNLLDAIAFISSLSQNTFLDAASAVLCQTRTIAELQTLFARSGNFVSDMMSFEVEMIVPGMGFDDFGMEVQAKNTFLRYRLVLGARFDAQTAFTGFELLEESLSHINLGSASHNLLFPHKASAWRYSAVTGRRSGGDFISTKSNGNNRIVELHTDGDGGGRPRLVPVSNLQRTVLSMVTGAENPTVLMAKREMQSWRRLRLEPTALRRTDALVNPPILGREGSHLASMIFRMNCELGPDSSSAPAPLSDSNWIYGQLAGFLKEHYRDVCEVKINLDERQGNLTVQAVDSSGVVHSVQSLPDGFLRLLALSATALDKRKNSLICLEEPETGMYPEVIPRLVDLLNAAVTDVNRAVCADNPLRQMIITTYSPVVLSHIPDDCILFAESFVLPKEGGIMKGVRFSSLPATWRNIERPESGTVERNEIFSTAGSLYLDTAEKPKVDAKQKSSTKNFRKPEQDQQSQPTLPY